MFILQNQCFHIVYLRTPKVSKPYNLGKPQPPNPLTATAAYTAEQRTKEFGIRKVLGASVSGLAGLLSREFLQLVLLSCLVAFPLSWWAMSNWLASYAYRTPIHWWVFAVAGLGAVTIALLTVSAQAIRAALANPVNSLRSPNI